jgi:hypothetical protein
MYEQLKSRVASLLTRPRPIKPQTERQLAHHLAEHSTSLPSFLLCASDALEDYELDILFGPLFTPALDERAELADLLFHWRPSAEQLRQIVHELCAEVSHAVVLLPDGTETKLTLHEVMVERYVRLLRLDNGPDPATAAALRDALAADLWPIGMALLCQRGMTPERQAWFAAFVNHMAQRRAVSRQLLETAADFIASQPKLEPAAVLAAAEALLRATEGTTAFAAGGHTYWSPDVAQHHQYRGQGKIDQERLQNRQAELECVTALLEDLRTFEVGAADDS